MKQKYFISRNHTRHLFLFNKIPNMHTELFCLSKFNVFRGNCLKGTPLLSLRPVKLQSIPFNDDSLLQRVELDNTNLTMTQFFFCKKLISVEELRWFISRRQYPKRNTSSFDHQGLHNGQLLPLLRPGGRRLWKDRIQLVAKALKCQIFIVASAH